jgi:hypothetical protein
MPEDKGHVLKPTVVVPPAAKRKRAKATDTSAGHTSVTSAPSKPTMVDGVERKRLPVTAGDLRQLSPGVHAVVVEKALRLLAGFVLERANERKAVLWGHELQQEHSDLVAQTLTLSQAPVLRKVQGYLGRMIDILQAVDIMAVCGHGDGAFGRYFKGMNAKIDRAEELDAARLELDQLVRHMSDAFTELLDLKEKLEQQARQFEEIATQAEAAALAALFLAQYLRAGNTGLAERFTERSMSLTQTLAQVRQNAAIREIQIEQPIRMVGAIQNVVLVTMPDFLASIATVVTLTARKANLTPTEAGELNYKLRDIINRLAT